MNNTEPTEAPAELPPLPEPINARCAACRRPMKAGMSGGVTQMLACECGCYSFTVMVGGEPAKYTSADMLAYATAALRASQERAEKGVNAP